MQTDASCPSGIGLALPTGHIRHDELLLEPRSGLYVPRGHSRNARRRLSLPASGHQPPLGHRSQLVASLLLENDPGGHAEHSDMPVRLLYCPEIHGKQLLAVWAPTEGM